MQDCEKKACTDEDPERVQYIDEDVNGSVDDEKLVVENKEFEGEQHKSEKKLTQETEKEPTKSEVQDKAENKKEEEKEDEDEEEFGVIGRHGAMLSLVWGCSLAYAGYIRAKVGSASTNPFDYPSRSQLRCVPSGRTLPSALTSPVPSCCSCCRSCLASCSPPAYLN